MRLWFYDPSGDKEGMLNHVVAKIDGPFCHCELQFPDQQACAIYMGSKVLMKARTFDASMYTSVPVSCNNTQLRSAREFADKEVAKETAFSTMAMSMALLPSLPYNGNGTFCSKLCADILIAAGLLEPSTPTHKLSPSALYRLFASSPPNPIKAPSNVVSAIDFK